MVNLRCATDWCSSCSGTEFDSSFFYCTMTQLDSTNIREQGHGCREKKDFTPFHAPFHFPHSFLAKHLIQKTPWRKLFKKKPLRNWRQWKRKPYKLSYCASVGNSLLFADILKAHLGGEVLCVLHFGISQYKDKLRLQCPCRKDKQAKSLLFKKKAQNKSSIYCSYRHTGTFNKFF